MEPNYESTLVFESPRGESWELKIDWTTSSFQSTRYDINIGGKFNNNDALRNAVERYVEKRRGEGVKVFDPQSR